MGAASLTVRARRSTLHRMDPDDLFAAKPKDPLAELARQDLDPLSVDELDARVALLEAEIARTRARRAFAADHRAVAEKLFRS